MTTETEKTIPDLLAVAGEMGERILTYDWSSTRLGPIDEWSASFRTTVSLMLHSRFPSILWWTEDYICFYNDAYIPVLGAKHPWGLGKPNRECWSEIWHILKPLIDSPYRGGPSTWMDDICLIINRNNFREETHFTISYSPAPDMSVPGGIGGVLATVIETTAPVINARALETLGKISSYVIGCESEKQVLVQAAKAIGENNSDFPFAAIYCIGEDGKEARLAASAGIAAGDEAAPERLDLSGGGGRFSFINEALETKEPVLIRNPRERFSHLPPGAWEEQPHHAMAIPIMLQGRQTPHVVMFAALNPFRQPDNQYGSFIRLVADQITQGLGTATVIEAERRRAEAMAELDKTKTQFFSNISHEFRTPITLMLGPLEELLNNQAAQLGMDTLQNIEMAHHNALRLLKLVNALLDFSRIESGRYSAHFAPTDVAAYTRNLAGNFRAAIEKAGLQFIVKADDSGRQAYLDSGMWEKIVFNLLSNALKYTLRGGITVELTTTVEKAELSVTDTGVGIPADELPNVFNRFHRVQNPGGRTFEGTGIGLSLVKELVQLHGGTTSVTSVRGTGSTFTVTIPFGKDHLPASHVTEIQGDIDHFGLPEYLGEAESLAAVQTLDAAVPDEVPGADDRASILVVDDNPDMRRHIQSIIGTRYDVQLAQNGMEALYLIAHRSPSLVLSDLMMPVMDGAQLVKELKQNRETSQIPVILITARAGEESRIEGFEMGADDYLVKPFSGRELLSRIRAQLRISKLRIHAYDQMRSVFMEAPVAIQILRGPEFVYELMNEHSARFMGLKKEAVIGRTVEEVMPDAREQGIMDQLRCVYEKGESYTANEMPYNFQRDGQSIPGFVRFIYTPLRDEEGRVDGVLVTGEDITSRVIARRKIESDIIERRRFAEKLEKEVDARTRELVMANKELESFNYVTSHDLQEPLRKIQMFIDRIKNDPASTESFLMKINESAMRMRQLIDSMLAYGRLTNYAAEKRRTDLNLVMAEVCRDFELLIEEKRATINIDPLPAVLANPFQMKQLFANLLSNSLKFCNDSPVVSVKAAVLAGLSITSDSPEAAQARPSDSGRPFAHIRFSDNGIGFEPQYNKKIFELFQRLHGKSQYTGTGIGLSIVKKIVDQHNGYVQAEPGENGGATFHLWLPVE